jgi:hypothetical protein
MNRKMMREDDDVENIGIMKGFMNSMFADEEDEGDEDSGESAAMMMERRPNSPEILMNNLRGDMRSIDARRDELADLVGYQAATETPEQVLAMLQPILAQQGGGGIGALPQSQPMAQGPQAPMMGGAPGMPPPGMPPLPPDGGMAPPMPPQGMGAPAPGGAPGMPPAPIGMARGGYVQNFQVGSSPAGVTSAEEDPAAAEDLALYPPELVNLARTQMSGILNRQEAAVPELSALMEKRLPQYRSLMGEDSGRGAAEAQLLLELGQRAFNFASNTDDAGRPLRGGFMSRLAGAAKTLPSAMGKHIESLNNIDLKLKTLALQAAEKDQDQVVANNTELLKRKSDIFGDILKEQAKVEAAKLKGSSVFGKGDWQWNVVNMPGLLERYAAGATDLSEDKLVSSAITRFKTPKFETRFDPVERVPYTVQVPGVVPDFVLEAEKARGLLGKSTAPTPAIVLPETSNVRTQGADGAVLPTKAPAAGTIALDTGEAQERPSVSLWKDRFKIAGPIAGAASAVSSIPGLGDPFADITLARQNAELFSERMIEALLKSTQGSVKEQERIRKVLNISPSAATDPDVYGTRLIALGNALRETIKEYNNQGSERSGLSPADKATARERSMTLQKQLKLLDLPIAVFSVEEFKGLPPGTEVLWMGTTPAIVK